MTEEILAKAWKTSGLLCNGFIANTWICSSTSLHSENCFKNDCLILRWSNLRNNRGKLSGCFHFNHIVISSYLVFNSSVDSADSQTTTRLPSLSLNDFLIGIPLPVTVFSNNSAFILSLAEFVSLFITNNYSAGLAFTVANLSVSCKMFGRLFACVGIGGAISSLLLSTVLNILQL